LEDILFYFCASLPLNSGWRTICGTRPTVLETLAYGLCWNFCWPASFHRSYL